MSLGRAGWGHKLPWEEARAAWLLLRRVGGEGGARGAAPGDSAAEEQPTPVPWAGKALVRRKGTLFPYLARPDDLEGSAFGTAEEAHQFESFAAAGAWVDQHGGRLISYWIVPAPETRKTDPAPNASAEPSGALERLAHVDQTEAEIDAARALGGRRCA